MDSNKNGKIYKQRLTTSIILTWAIIIMSIGIIILILGIVGFFSKNSNDINIRSLYVIALPLVLYGLGIITVGSLIYIIGALSKDVYDILYFSDFQTQENMNFHKYLGNRMNEIETNQEQIRNGIARISSLIENEKENRRRSTL